MRGYIVDSIRFNAAILVRYTRDRATPLLKYNYLTDYCITIAASKRSIAFCFLYSNDFTSVNNSFPRLSATCFLKKRTLTVESQRSSNTTVVNHTEKFYELETIKTLKQTTVVANVPSDCGNIENYGRFTGYRS